MGTKASQIPGGSGSIAMRARQRREAMQDLHRWIDRSREREREKKKKKKKKKKNCLPDVIWAREKSCFCCSFYLERKEKKRVEERRWGATLFPPLENLTTCSTREEEEEEEEEVIVCPSLGGCMLLCVHIGMGQGPVDVLGVALA